MEDKFSHNLKMMGETVSGLDERMQEIFAIIDDICVRKLRAISSKKVLDAGLGKGQIAIDFAKRGYDVSGVGLNVTSYDENIFDKLRKLNINCYECNIEKMPFKDSTFDIVIMSHVLEHCLNIGAVLNEVKRILKQDGYLIIFVPPYSNTITAGHVTSGWNVGQLVYILATLGYNVKEGEFISLIHSVLAVVQNNGICLSEKLVGDKGDIQLLSNYNVFPFYLSKNCDESKDSYPAELFSLNFPNADIFHKNIRTKYSIFSKIILKIFFILPKRIQIKTISILYLLKNEKIRIMYNNVDKI